MKLFFDTETTGKCNFKRGPSDPSQPRIVQLAALLCDDAGREDNFLNVIIKPEGWSIPQEAAGIHGITTERALADGITMADALERFAELIAETDIVIAHNVDFDALVVSSEFIRDGGRFSLPSKRFCTMKATTHICKLPGMHGYKWPKLSEAYRHFFGVDLEGAHDALSDVRACARIYFAIQK